VVLARTAPMTLEVDGERLSVSTLAGASVLAVSGLGDPAAFEDTLARLGARVVASRRLGDHGGLAEDGWARVADEARRTGARWVVVTRKDAVKGPHAGRAVLDVATEVVEGAALDARLDAVLAGARSTVPAPTEPFSGLRPGGPGSA
jgi:tetraacyldisaccharide-1-P 4'-kinase